MCKNISMSSSSSLDVFATVKERRGRRADDIRLSGMGSAANILEAGREACTPRAGVLRVNSVS